MKTKLIGLLAVLAIAVLSFGTFTALAQYPTEERADFTLSSTGTTTIAQSSTVGNVEITIVGAPGATGSVSTATYTGNPNPDASKPSNVGLTHFFAITFNDIAPADFTNATIVITFTDAEVSSFAQPYVLYKYNPDTNTFNAIDAEIDYTAHTITAVLTSTTDPLFAIGGVVNVSTPTPTAAPTTEPETAISLSTWAWIFVAIEAITGFILIIGVYQAQRSARAKKSVQ